jgi:antitoxin VapB
VVEVSLNIKNPEAHALAERVAKLTGETLTDAVRVALRERLARLENVSAIDEERYRELDALIKGSRTLWREPYLSTDHGELLYDKLGLPK